MILKGKILGTLEDLERLYKKSRGATKADYFSKMALLELCGWTEVSMDEIVKRCVKRKINEPRIAKILSDELEKVSGFKYETHFRKMLTRVIGEITFIKVEKSLDPTQLTQLKTTLSALKPKRDSEAHTHLFASLKTLDTPSVMIAHFKVIHTGLVEFDRELRRSGN